jgi:hypothetical protein
MSKYALMVSCALSAFWGTTDQACAAAQQAGVIGPTVRAARGNLSPSLDDGPFSGYQVGAARKFRTFSFAAADEVSSSFSPDLTSPTLPVFASDSFWYTTIPADAPMHPNSAGYVQEFLQQLKKYNGNIAISTADYSSPIYVVDDIVVTVPVTQWDCQKVGYLNKELEQQWQTVPIPPYAQPASGTDSEMTVYQPLKDTMWEFWRARKVDQRWEACWGGRMLNVSKNEGIWPLHYGATATGLPFLGGQITVDELRRGVISHAIGIALVEAEDKKIYSWPASRSDGLNPSNKPDQIPEGLRFRLDPNLDVDALRIHPVAKMIAKAAQAYGFVVWDTSGGISLRAENSKRFTTIGMSDPYPALWDGTPSYRILTGFPWNGLQFLPMNYGMP